jgi:hypothetical protein
MPPTSFREERIGVAVESSVQAEGESAAAAIDAFDKAFLISRIERTGVALL